MGKSYRERNKYDDREEMIRKDTEFKFRRSSKRSFIDGDVSISRKKHRSNQEEYEFVYDEY